MNCFLRTRRIAALGVLLFGHLCATAAAQVAPDDWNGDWAGWSYAADLDFPFRLSATVGAAPTFFTPASDALNLVPSKLAEVSSGWEASGKIDDGREFALEVRRDDGRLAGHGRIGADIEFDFELWPAARRLAATPTNAVDEYSGTYVGSNGAYVLVGEWPWGEVIVDWDSVRRTAFFTGPDELLLGPSLYTVSAEWARGKFLRDASGAVRGIRLEGEAGRCEASRVELREVDVVAPSDGGELRGTLVLPPGPGPHPAVVVVGGSDWSERSDTLQWARRFAAFGVAGLAYDRAGNGESDGDRLEWFGQTARDAASAAQALRERDDVLAEAVGVAGISRGGWAAPLAAVIDPKVAFVIGFVAPAVTPERQETTRRINELRPDLRAPGDEELAREYLAAIGDYDVAGVGWDRYEQLHEEVESRGWLDVLGESAARLSPDWAWTRLNWRFDPVPYLRELACPVLIVLGGEDPNVTPAENEPLWRAALTDAPTDDWSVDLIPGGDHGYRLGGLIAGRPPRLHDARGRSPRTWPLVRAWVRARFLASGQPR